MIRVLIAAPTPALRAGLRALVATTELQIAGVAATLVALDVDIAVLPQIDANAASIPTPTPARRPAMLTGIL